MGTSVNLRSKMLVIFGKMFIQKLFTLVCKIHIVLSIVWGILFIINYIFYAVMISEHIFWLKVFGLLKLLEQLEIFLLQKIKCFFNVTNDKN